jgi:hypothetical protein
MDATQLDNIFAEFKMSIIEFANDPKNRNNLYDYESKFREITQEHEQKILQATIGDIPKSKNKKKL